MDTTDQYHIDGICIIPEKKGRRRFIKTSYPVRYGRFSEIVTSRHTYQFNLNGEIKFIQGKSGHWPHPAEWLKRTIANDWVYYSTGSYNDIFDLTGEYYLPCPSYPTNQVRGGQPFEYPEVKNALHAWQKFVPRLKQLAGPLPPKPIGALLERLGTYSDEALIQRQQRLHHILGARPTVLPPDTRHVDYDVIPLMIADGCSYNCGFCRVKSGRDFTPRSKSDILDQIKALKSFFGPDLANYNGLFLGDHDALAAGAELIEYAASTAYRYLDLPGANLDGAYLFLFGGAEALLNAGANLFDMLNQLPFYTFINVGLESADGTSLQQIGKPLSPTQVEAAFDRLTALNAQYANLEISANFLLSPHLPETHLASLQKLLYNRPARFLGKGAVYVSPVTVNSHNQGFKATFYALKKGSRLPAYLYLIQRL